MFSTIQAGLLTELKCQEEFSSYGILLSQPIISDSRYDFIADINYKLYKIQCKTCSVAEDESYISFATSTKNWNTKDIHYYSENEIDFFYTYYKGKSYLVPVCEAQNKTKTLRFFTSSNNHNGISWAKDYEFSVILKKLNYEESKKEEEYSIIKLKKCPDCGQFIARTSTKCLACSQKDKKNIDNPNVTREELKKMIRTLPFTQIGEKFCVSDNAIRKWCDKYNLPRTKKEISSINDEDWSKI